MAALVDVITELAGLASAYELEGADGTRVDIQLEQYGPIVQLIQAGDMQAAHQLLDALEPSSLSPIRISMHRPLDGGAAQLDVHLSVHLHVTMQLEARCCCLTSDNPLCADQGWISRVEGELQDCVHLAMSQGEPYLFQIVSHLESALSQRATDLTKSQQCHPHDATHVTPSTTQHETQAAPSSQDRHHHHHHHKPQQQQEEQLDVLVIRIDHMHNRHMYTRTLRAWFSELGITGRCVFYNSSKRAQGGGASGLIVVVLEGEPEQLKKYLTRHRTETIDVDSSGRKCRERMMQVVLQRPQRHSTRAFGDYTELDCSCMAEMTEVLTRVGLSDCIKDILGISSR